MQALNTFSLGQRPMARPQTFLALARSLQRRQKLAQKIHSLPKVNFLCGTSLSARSQTCSALLISPAISSSKTAQLNQMYMQRLQNRFSSAGGFSLIAASYTSRTLSRFLKLSSRKMRLSQASQLSGFLAIWSLQRLRRSPRTTSSISSEVPCSFQKLRQSSYSFLACSFGTCFSPNLKICRARSYSRSLISNLANSRKQFSLSASEPSSVMMRSQMRRVASFSLFLNSNLATLRQVSRVGKVSRQRQSTFFARSGSPMRSSNLMKAIQAFSPGHHSIQRSKTSLVRTYSPMSSSMQAYLNQNWSSLGRQQMARSQTLRAWLINLFFISISAYFSQRLLFVQSISRARSKTDLARAYSLRFYSHCPQRTQMERLQRWRRSLSSNSRRFSCLQTCSSFSSMMRCTGGRNVIGLWISASFRIWSAVICTAAASLFLIGGGAISICVILLQYYTTPLTSLINQWTVAIGDRYNFMQQLSRQAEGFDQADQDHLVSKEKDKNRETNLYFKIPEAKPLLSKHYIDYSKPKVLIKEVRVAKEPVRLTQAALAWTAPPSDRVQLGRKEEVKTAESTLWKRYIISNNFRCLFAKFLAAPIDYSDPKMGRKLRHQVMKMTMQREYLFATYIMDINFLNEGGSSTFLKNLEESSLQDQQVALATQPRNISFDSRFQCGNLMYVFERNDHQQNQVKEYHLVLQNDVNTKGYGNWFYFRLASKSKGKHRFHIVNIQKNFSFFGYGMRPVVFSLQKMKQLGAEWHYDGYNLVYQRNQLLKDQTGQQHFNTFSFTYEQQYDNDVLYFAAALPYSYSKLISFIDHAERTAKAVSNVYLRKEALAATLSSNECPLLTLTWKRDKKREEKAKKKLILIIARQHPSEIVSSFVMEGVINCLLQCGEAAVDLLKRYIFKLVPMANIDGVIYGNSRCDIAGSDANRKWTRGSNQFLYPVITALKKMVSNLIFEGYEIEYFIDLHGHSRKLGSFIYACKSYDEIETRMFSWIMGKVNPKFSYQHCRFGISNFRRETARGYMMNIATNRKAMTLETSFYGNKTPNGPKPFETEDLRQLGASLIEAIHIDTFRSSKQINWTTVRSEIRATIHTRALEGEEEEQSSGSDSNPEIDQLTLKEKVDTFLTPASASKLGLIDIRVVEKARKEEANRQANFVDNDPFSNHQVFNQDYDTILNQKYLQSQVLPKPQKPAAIQSSKSVTKVRPFRFKSLQKKPLSLNKKIQIAIDVQRVQKKEQRLSTPTLPSVINRNGKEFWSSLKKEYENLVNQKKQLIKATELPRYGK